MNTTTLTIKTNVLLKRFSTFGIGGPARYFCEVKSIEELKEALDFAKQNDITFLPIGNGSNCLFDDKGFNGLIILCKISSFLQEDNSFTVGSGFSFPKLGALTAKQGFSGLEFACGIPATVGGAICMNAGAGGGETKDCLISVTYLDSDGRLSVYTKDRIQFGYRYSEFQQRKGVIVSAIFQLYQDPEAKSRQQNLLKYRLETQPYKNKSIGCCFRNPDSLAASQLIDSLELKGTKIGGAMVSPKHANFIVNTGNATAEDVKKLIKLIQNKIKQEYGISLMEEVKYIPYEISS